MPPTATMPSASDALSALNAYQVPDSASVLSQAETQYGVPQLQQQVQSLQGLTGNLTNAIAAVDPSVTGRTAGTLTTEAQRGALVNREQAPITAQLGTANTALGQTTSNYNTAEGNAKDAATAKEADNQAQYQKLLDTYNIANARETAQQQAGAQAAQQAEAVREYNQSESDANRNAAASNSAANAKASAPTVSTAAQNTVSEFNRLKGGDGKVSNQTWQNALNDYTAVGGKVSDFWANYGNYVNNKYIKSYAGYGAIHPKQA